MLKENEQKILEEAENLRDSVMAGYEAAGL